jgi:hypothetical protein
MNGDRSMPPPQQPERPSDAGDRRGWARRLADWLLGRDPEFDRVSADIDRRRRELREKNARGTRRTSDPTV